MLLLLYVKGHIPVKKNGPVASEDLLQCANWEHYKKNSRYLSLIEERNIVLPVSCRMAYPHFQSSSWAGSVCV